MTPRVPAAQMEGQWDTLSAKAKLRICHQIISPTPQWGVHRPTETHTFSTVTCTHLRTYTYKQTNGAASTILTTASHTSRQ